jgi:branched-chain amino acid transport system ATP-binding protein
VTTTPESTLTVTGLKVCYGPARAVGGVSFTVEAGSVLTVLGANGAGKSSVARACSGLVPVTEGTVRIGDLDVTNMAPYRIRRAGLVYLPETRGIFPSLSVADNLRMAVRLCKRPPQAADAAYEMFPILAKRRRQQAGSLSGGEQQMLSLVRALVGQPKIVIIDEPSMGLSPMLVEQIFAALDEAKQRGLTMVLIEQFVHRALALSEHCIVMSRGQVAWSGPAASAGEVLDEHYLGSIGDSGETRRHEVTSGSESRGAPGRRLSSSAESSE